METWGKVTPEVATWRYWVRYTPPRHPPAAPPRGLACCLGLFGMSQPVDLCLPLLLQTPPGQLRNVYNDLKGILAHAGEGAARDDAALAERAQPFLEQRSHEQLVIAAVEHEGKSEPTIVSEAAKLAGPSPRYVHPKLNLSYAFDHIDETPHDVKPFSAHSKLSELRAAVDEHLGRYVYDHYQAGVSSVFAPPYAGAAEIQSSTESASTEKPNEAGAEPSASESAKESNQEGAEETKEAPAPVSDESKEAVAEAAGEAAEPASGAAKHDAKEDTAETKESAAEAVKEGAAAESENKAAGGEGATEDAEKNGAGEASADGAAEPAVEAAEQPENTAPEASAPQEAPQDQAEQAEQSTQAEQPEPTELVIHIVGRKYNLRNFWAGQWRSSYVFDTTSRTFTKAQIQVRVHYFENGNVQLDTRNEAVEGLDLSLTEDASTDATAKALVEAIAKHEQAYHESLYNTIDALRERAFKGLRRTLPITRQKIGAGRQL